MKREKYNPPPRAEKTQEEMPGAFAGLSPAASDKMQRRWTRKRWILGLVLVFFLFSVIFIIPVGHIPVLRNLAWMMGFSAQDTQSMSFGRTLLTWAGDGERRARPGSWSGNDGAVLSLFDRNVQAGFNASGPGSGLFDLGAVNASRRAKGLGADGLYGAYYGDLSDEERAALNRRVSGWSREARQAAAKKEKAEVYFGEDADIAARAAAAAASPVKGSSDTVGLLPKANVVGSVHTDWLGQAIDKASLLSTGQLDEALGDKATSGTTPLSNLGGSLSAGERPQRDLARAWLMSGAANKAPQLMLKKQLASAGYMGMEMPKKVFDSSGEGSGVRLSGDEMMSSFEDANKRLLDEEQCRKLGKQANSNVGPKLDESRNLIRQIRRGVPKNCDGVSSWKNNLTTVQSNCKAVKDTFSNMKMACGVKLESEGRCETTYLSSYADDLSGACEALELVKMANPPDPDAIAAAEAKRDEIIKGFNSDQLDNTFNINVDGVAGGNDFFPVTAENKSWIGQ